MRHWGRTLVLSGVLLVAGVVASRGAEGPVVRAHLSPADVVVGQEQRLVVDVLVPTWLLGAPRLPELSIPGVIVVPSGETGVNLTETIDGSTWSGVSNEYALYSQRAGAFETPADDVRIEFAIEGKRSVAEVPIPAQAFAAHLPPGVPRGEHVLSAGSLQVTQQIEPRPEDLRVGDSLRRTIQIEATDTRAMLLPARGVESIEGLAAYPDTPRLVDRPGRRGAPPVAERIESTSWIFERPGTYVLPAVAIRWWNTEEGRLETAELPGVSFEVAPNPAMRSGLSSRRTSWSPWVAAGAIVLALAAIVLARRRGWIRTASHAVASRLERARNSERSYFGAFVRATRRGDPTGVLRAFFRWLDRRGPRDRSATTDGFVAESSSPELGREVAALEASLFAEKPPISEAEEGWSAARLRRAAVVARARAAEVDEEGDAPLPRLNP